MEKYPVWIDCDPGVDDAAALLLAHRQAETDIVGISTVAGNVDLEKTTKNQSRMEDLSYLCVRICNHEIAETQVGNSQPTRFSDISHHPVWRYRCRPSRFISDRLLYYE